MSLRLVSTIALLTIASSSLATYQATSNLPAAPSPESMTTQGDNFLPKGTPFINPMRAQQVNCVNRCGNQFQLPSIDGGYHPKHTSQVVIQSEHYQKACLKHCLR